MFSQARNHGGRTHRIPDSPDVECYNCHKKGHTRDNCWSKGGGKEGQGPRTNMKARRSYMDNGRIAQIKHRQTRT